MFRNYLKTAIRFLLKNKTFSLINIIGLAVGTLCCLYIVLYVEDQYSYDRQHKDVADIYRIITTLTLPGDALHNNSTCSPPIAPAMKQDFPEVKQYTRIVNAAALGVQNNLLRYNTRSFYEKKFFYVDSTFFDIFTYHFDAGDPATCLNAPYTAVLEKPIADKLFGSDNAVGKVIEINNEFGKHDFTVTGVIDNRLGKSHLDADVLVAMNSGGLGTYTRQNKTWAGNNYTDSYVKLYPHSDPKALERKLPAFLNKYGADQMKQLGMTKQLHLQPMTAIHTTPGLEVELSKTVSPGFLRILLLIAVMIQVIACINFMNLSTARASNRAKEVGVRKVIGAERNDLMKQFIGESFLLSLAGVLIALPLLILSLPFLNGITGADIHFHPSDYRIWVILTGIFAVTGLVAGSYPAFYLSGFQAIKVIKGNFTNNISAAGIRRALVIFQFVLSIVLIAGIIVINSQLNFIKHKDLGFDQHQKLIFGFYTDDSRAKMDAFAQDLRQMAEVQAVGKSDTYLSEFVPKDHGVYLQGGDESNAIDAQNASTDEYFVKANGIRIIAGRDFHRYDSGKVLVNETLLKQLGLPVDKAPGTRLYSGTKPDPVTYVEIAGVMKDFNYNSLHGAVKPFMLVYNPTAYDVSTLTVAVNSTNYQNLLGRMEKIWRQDLPFAPFEYTFLDQEVQKQYDTEITLSNIINSFTLIAILISCLGLFGLAAFSAEQRKKEIGIRKVLGAGTTTLVRLLSGDFLRLVGVAILIAVPIAWWAMHQWLQSFAYRVPLSWWMFAVAGAIAILIALVTVSFQAIRAAVANPVRSLRSE